MSKKLDYEFIKSIFQQNGCVLISDTYEGYDKKLKYICNCGREAIITYRDFIKGHRCRECAGERASAAERYSYDYIKEQFAKRGCVLISTIYINCEQKLDYICKCGNHYQMTYSSFRIGSKCPECIKIEGTKRRHAYEFIYQYFEDHNCHLLSTEYKGNHKLLDYICECGNKAQISFAHFQNGKRCKQCGSRKTGLNSRTPEKEIYEMVVLSGYTLNKIGWEDKTKLNITCDQGHTYEVLLSKFKSGQRCRECHLTNNVGPNNPKWNPNLTEEDRILNRDYKTYEDWRKSVFERDNYTCQVCGAYGVTINAHHLDGYNWCIEKRLDIENGRTCCDICHRDFHSRFGNKNNTKGQFEEYLHLREEAQVASF